MNKKQITMIAGASLMALGVPSVVFAQGAPAASGPFADVPADHWAYASVDSLQKAGIVIGYPDGTYGGKRAMTRYEFAVAIARLLPLLNKTGNMDNYATKDDLAALRTDLETKLQANSDAIDALRKLVDEFTPELQKLGQDVAAVKDRLDALEARVAAVETEQRRVKITGDVNIIARAENITKGSEFQDKNGNTLTSMDVPFGTTAKHLLVNSSVDHDVVLDIRGHVSDTATANIMLDFGNYLSTIGNTAAAGPGFGASGFSGLPGDETETVWEANLEMPVSLGPLGGADLIAGRFGNQWTKYTLQQVDADVYTSLYQTDSGNITTDGAKATLKIGPANVNAWAGKLSDIAFSQPYGGSGSLATVPHAQTLPTGQYLGTSIAPLLQGAGVRATFGNPDNGVLGVNVEQFGIGLDSNVAVGGPIVPGNPESGREFGVLSVYGLDFNGAFPVIHRSGLTLDANWNDSAEGTNSHGFNDVGKDWRFQSTDDQVGIAIGALSLKGGYQYVGPDYSAPGYWGKVGAWANPNNVEGAVGSAKYAMSSKITLNGDIEAYKAAYGTLDGNANTIQSPLQAGDKVNHYQVGAAYGLTSNYDVDLGYEEVNWDLKDTNDTLLTSDGFKHPGKPTQSFLTIGLGHTFNPNASFKLLYQIVQYRDKGTGFSGTIPGTNTLAGDSDGNVAVGQFSLKF